MLLPIIAAPAPEAVAEDKEPKFTINTNPSSGNVIEGDPITFTVILNNANDILPDGEELEVKCKTKNEGKYINATKDKDYVEKNYSICHTFEGPVRGSNNFSVSITTNRDTFYEPDEKFTFEVTAGGKTFTKTATIKDTNVKPKLEITPKEVTEGDETVTVTLTFTLSGGNDLDYPITYDYDFPKDRTVTTTIGYGGATMKDVGSPGSAITINTGEKTASSTFNIEGDEIPEPNEKLDINIGAMGNYASNIRSGEFTITIIDDDPVEEDIRVYLAGKESGSSSKTQLEIAEGETVEVEAMLAAPASEKIIIPITAKSISEPANTNDFSISNQITIPAGEPSGSTELTIEIDSANDSSRYEALLIELGEMPEGFKKGDRSKLAVVMHDNDPLTAELKNLSPKTISENNGKATFEVHLARPLAIRPPAAGAEFQGMRLQEDEGFKARLNYLPKASNGAEKEKDFDTSADPTDFHSCLGRRTCEVTVTAKDDKYYEGTEGVEISLSTSSTHEGASIRITGDPLSLSIEDDDMVPSVKLSVDADTGTDSVQNSLAEDGGEKMVRVTATLEGGSVFPEKKTVTVEVGAADDDATEGTDYKTVALQSIMINAGETSGYMDFTLTPMQDVLHEGTETISVNGMLEGVEEVEDTTITITDDDAAPSGITLSVDTNGAEDGTPSTVAEDAGATVVTVTATVNGTTRYVDDKTVAVSVADGTAASPADYAAVSNFDITILAGAASHTGSFTVTPVDDDLDESDETIDVTGTLTDITVTNATVTLTDTDEPVSFSIADAEATEGGKVTFTVSRKGAEDNVASVKVTTAADSGDGVNAADADDYTAIATAQTLNFAKGVTSQTVEVQTSQDNLFEPDETFLAVLSTPALADGDPGTGVTIESGKGTATGTIKNDDTEPSFAVADASAAEGDAITFTVTRSGAMDNVVSVKWNTKAATGAGAASDTDYTPMTMATKLDFAKGVETQTFTVATTEDNLHEGNETFLVELTGAVGGTITTAQATGTINDDDAAPTGITLSVDTNGSTEGTPSTVAEDAGDTVVTVTATVNGTTRYVDAKTVAVSVADGTAASPADYAAVSNFDITILAGAASHTGSFTVTPVDDDLDESDETIDVTGTLTDITVTNATVTLTDTDEPVSFSIADAEATEGGKVTFTVSRKGAEDNVASVKVTTAADSGDGVNAADADDYTAIATAQTLNFAKGVTSQTVEVQTSQDNLFEPDETFLAVLSTPALADGDPGTGVTIESGKGTATGTIKNDDTEPSFAVADASAAEGDAITFTVTRSGAMDNVVSVKWNTKAATGAGAASDTDYTPMTMATKLDFAKGVETQTFTVATTEDTLNEANETFLIELTEPVGAIIGDAEATGTITNDDAAPTTLTLAVDADNNTENVQSSLAENGGAKTVKVTATLGGSTQFDVDKTLTLIVGKDGDSATEGTDYTNVDDITLTISAGDQDVEHTFTLTPTDDAFREDTETISFDATLGEVIVTGASITLTSDDAAPAITLTVDADKDTDNVQTTIAEDGGVKTVRVTATLDGTTRLEEAADLTLAVGKNGDSATEGTDYTNVADRTITIGAGVASVTHDFTLTPTNDNLYEGSETISLDGTLAGVTVTDTSLTLTDDDVQPSFAVADASAAEGDAITFTVTRSGAMDNVVSVKWNTKAATGDGVASSSDYTEATTATKLDFAKGVGSQTFTVATTEDTLNEADETFLVELTEPVGATITTAQATGTITDDDAAPTTLTLAVDADNGTDNVQSSLAENSGAKTVKVTATLGGSTQFDMDKTLTLIVGDDDDSATEGTDYTNVADVTLTIPAGDQDVEHTFTLTPTDDAFREDSETISFDATLTGVIVTGASIMLTSEDAAPAITLTVDADKDTDNVQTTIAEDGGVKTVRVTATLDGTTLLEEAADLTLAVGKNSDSATEGTDYTDVADRTINIGAGVASVTHDFTLTPTNDNLYEGSETISLDGTLTGVTVTNTSLTLTDDDEAPSGITLSVSPDTVGEEDGKTEITVTATVNGETRYVDAKTVTVSVGGGTAISGTDYTAVPSFDITIAAGDASKAGTFDLTPTSEDLYEGNETIDVTGSSSSITFTNATITLEDDDTQPSFAVADSSASEGDAITFTVTRSGAMDNAVSVKWNTRAATGDNAASASDYTAMTTATKLDFAKDVSRQTFTVATTEDNLHEGDETFLVELTDAEGGTIATAEATGTITDDDAAPSGITLSVSPDTVGEEDGKTEITVTATVNGETRYVDAKTVTVSVGGGTATSATDYGAVENFDITIAAGDASKAGTFDLTPTSEDLYEGNETIDVTGSSSSVTVTKATITLEDNDIQPSFAVADSSASEGDAITFTVTRTGAMDNVVSVKWNTRAATGDNAASASDYTAMTTATKLDFAKDVSRQTFTVATTEDNLHEGDETFLVELTDAEGGTIATAEATGTITDDDAAPSGITLSVSPDTVGEEDGKTEITVTATVNGETRYVDAKTVTVSVGGGTATSATDYGAVENFDITIAAGDASKAGTFDLTPTSEDLYEGNETIDVTGSSSSVTVTKATITLEDNDIQPSFAVADSSASEGDAITFTVTRTGAMDNVVSVKWNTKAATGDEAASASDYTAMTTPTKLDFAKGVSRQTFTVATTPDNLHEGDETFLVELTDAEGGTIATAEATGTITDDDAAPSGITLSVSQAAVGEEDGKTEITVTATVNGETRYVDAKTVTVSVGGGTAISGTDYDAVANFDITIAAGDASKTGTFDLTPTNDVLDEVNETIDITGTSGGLTITPATVTITDNDDAPSGITLSVSQAAVGEEDGETEITVTATVNGSTRYVDAKTVTVSVGGGTAISGTDYDAVANFDITIAAGEASKTGTFDLTPTNDVLDEANETIDITGTSGSLTITPATITITDDDAAPTGITLTVSPTAVGEEDGETKITVTATVNGSTRYVDAKTVTVSVGGGTAISGTDYDAVANFDITIAAGEASKTGTFDLTPTNDVLDEANETIDITGTSGSLTITPATITITDNDDAPSGITLSVSQAAVGEEDGETKITVTATVNGSTRYVDAKTVTVSVGGGTAISGTDYDAVANFDITIAAGEASKTGTFDLTPTNDVLDETNETIDITGTSGSLTITPATITITDDDAAPTGITLTVSPTAVGEEDGETKITVTATVNGSTRYVDAKTVTVSVGGGTAISGTDYDAVANFDITIAAGEASKTGTFDLTPTNDVLDEANETINITGTSGSLTITPATITITDNDDAPSGITLSVSQAAVGEEDGETKITVTATVNGSTRYVDAKTVTVSVGGGTAISGTDYDAVANFDITIAAGEASKTGTFDLTPTNDVLDEANETINVTGTSGSLTITPATITITDNDAAPSGITLSVSQAAVGEEDGETEITVTATVNGSTRYVDAKTVTVSVGGGTAISGTDYDAVANFDITIAAGEASKTGTFDLTPTNDVLDEANETINITGTSGSLTITPATITITDNDDAPSGITLSVSQAAVGEEDGETKITVTATVNGSTRYVDAKTVTVSVGGGTAISGTDYDAVANFDITIAAGDASKTGTFDLTPTNDVLHEANETINVTGTSGSLTITPATITITDNDAAPSGITLSVSQAAVGEGAGETEITVTATVNGSTRYVDAKTVTVSVGGGTATSATDYGAVENFDIIIAAGEASKSGTFDLAPTDDDLHEGSETIDVTGTSGSITVTKATISLTDDDGQPSFAVADANAAEGEVITFTVTRSGAMDNAVSVKWNTKAATGAGAASASDYTAMTTATKLDFAKGVSSQTFTVATTEDTLHEGNETFLVELTEPVGATISDAEATGTITDDDAAPTALTLTVDADTSTNNVQNSLAEDGGAKTVRVTATLGGSSTFIEAKTVTVDVGVDADSAEEGTDYTTVALQSITIDAGSLSGYVEFTLTPMQDVLAEGSETISLDGTLAGVTVTDATITLTDDDTAPNGITLSVSPTAVGEGAGETEITVTATVNGSTRYVDAKTVTVSVGGGTATSATDYGAVENFDITIAAGDASKTGTFDLTPTNDVLDEANETIDITGTSGSLTITPATITITDNDAAPSGITLSVSQAAVGEEDGETEITVTATVNGSTRYVDAKTVTVSVGGGTATSATDYGAVENFDIIIAAGDASKSGTFDLTPTNDVLHEANETINVTGTSGSLTITPATVTITDDDAAPSGITLSVSPATVGEGAGETEITVTATVNGTTRYVDAKTVTVSVGGGTATSATDYGAVENFDIIIAAGEASKSGTFDLAPTDDDLHEGSETIDVTGTSGSITITKATISLTDNDGQPSFAVADASAGEGEVITFTVTRSGAMDNAVSVKWNTKADSGDDAASTSDYTTMTTATKLDFAKGVGSQTFTVATTEDVLVEGDETFLVELTEPVGATISDAEATGTITDDDAAPTGITLSVSPTTVEEGAGETEITVTATVNGSTRYADAKTVTVSVGGGTATSATDYGAVENFDIIIAAGDASKSGTFDLTPTDDDLHEGSETIDVTGSTSGSITITKATISLTDNDGQPSFAVADASAAEGEAITFTVTRSGAMDNAVSVKWNTKAASGTGAASTSDYTTMTTATKLDFAKGVGSQTFTVATTEDVLVEGDETFLVELTEPVGATISDAEATGTITDDDAAPTGITLSVSPTTVGEGAGETEITVTATVNGSTRYAEDKTVTVSVGGGTATSATDYGAVENFDIIIAAGDASKSGTFDLTPTDDDLHEGSETIDVTGSTSGSITITKATISLTDNDAAPSGITLSVSPTTVGEGAGETEITVTATVNGTTRYVDAKTVTVSVGGGTATSATDYGAVENFDIIIAAGEASKSGTFDLTPTDDDLHEGSETIDVTGSTSGSITITKATISLTDNDGQPSFAVADASAAEGEVITFTVTRSGAMDNAVSVKWNTKAASGTGAASTSDYTTMTTATKLDFAKGVGSQTFTVATTEDVLVEGDETFLVELTEPVGATISDAEATGTITDDDAAPTGITLSVSPTTVGEGAGETEITVTATVNGSTRYAEDKTVTVSVGGGTATSATDYGAVENFDIIIAAGDASKSGTFDLTPTDDDLHEGSETIDVTGSTSGSITITKATISLTDNDGQPSFAVADASAAEGEVITFTVTRSGAMDNAVSVKWNTKAASGTGAASTSDYTTMTTATKLDFAKGVGSQTFTVATTEDVLVEGDETFLVELTEPVGATISDAEATGTITDDDAAPTGITLSVSPTTVGEGAGETEITVTATVNGSTRYAEDKTVTVSVGGGTATSATDYGAVENFDIIIAAGDASKSGTFDLTPTDDDLHEGSETIDVTGSTSGSITITKATISLTDNDGQPSFAVADASAAEGEAITFTVTRSGAMDNAVSVKWNTKAASGTGAASTSDYTTMTTATKLDFAKGVGSQTFTVATTEDVLVEGDETFLVELTEPVGATISDAEATGTITDDDAAPTGITLSVSPTTVGEGAGETEITVTATVNGSTRYAEDKTVTVSVGGGTATSATDYDAVANFDIIIAASEASKSGTFDLTPTQDNLHEGSETIDVTGSTSGSITVTKATISLTDDDGQPSFAVADASAAEGEAITFTVTRSGAMDNAVSVKWNTKADSGDDAASTSDYTEATTATKLDFAKGVGSQTFTVATTEDNLHEGDETFLVELTEPVGATISDAEATGTITDDDAAPTGITLSVSPTTVGEGAGETEITVTATVNGSTRYAEDKTVTVSVGGGTATSATDYGAVENFDIIIAAGEASKSGTFDLTPTDDDLHEGSETIDVTGSTSGSITITKATISLTDNDGQPSFAVADASAAEGEVITFTVTRSGAMDNAVSVKWNTKAASGTGAASTSDYTTMTTATKLDFAKGVGSQTFTVATTEDVLVEGDETFLVELTEPVGATISDAEATGTITDDDAAPTGITLSVSPTTVGEGAGETEITVTATVNGSTRYAEDKTVTVSVGGGTATSATDYDAVANFDIIIAASEASKSGTFDLTPTQDNLHEGSETIDVTGSTSGSITVTKATISLTDDDGQPSFAVADASAAEGEAITFTVTRSGAMDNAVSVKWNTKADSGDDAASTSDYTEATTATKLDFAKGVGSQTFTVATTEDNLHEGDETFLVELTEPVGATISDAEATGTITDDDATPPTALTITVDTDSDTGGDQKSIDENAGAPMVTVTATLDGTSRFGVNKDVTVKIGKDSDTAVEGTDYEEVGDLTVRINAGDASGSKTFTLTLTDDVIDEEDETISVEGTLETLAVTNDSITITDADEPPSGLKIMVDTDPVKEGNQDSVDEDAGGTTVKVTVTLNGTTFGVDKTVNVTIGKENDTAKKGEDYRTGSKTKTINDLTFTLKAEEASASETFTLTPIDDEIDEEDETISLNGTLTGVTVTDATITLTDDDEAPSGFTITVDTDPDTDGDQNSVGEDPVATTVTVTATLDGTSLFASNQTVTVTVGADSNTDEEGKAVSGTDYTPVPNFDITINAGKASGSNTFTLTPKHDILVEGKETISVTGKLGSFDDAKATIIITDNDAAPTGLRISVDTGSPENLGSSTRNLSSERDRSLLYEDAETTTTVAVTATLDGNSRFSVEKTVTVSIGGGTATWGTDYTAVPHFDITIGAGAKSGTSTFDITPIDDKLAEGDETINLEGTLTGITVTGTTITITDDDTAPTGITLTVDPASVGEEDGKPEITVKAAVNGATRYTKAKTVTVSVGGGTATSETDYEEVPGFDITIGAGAESATHTFTLILIDDKIHEGDETINVTGTSGSLTVTDATLTIEDDEELPVVSINSPSVKESGKSGVPTEMTFTVTIFPESTKLVTVSYADTGTGTASADKDYVSPGTGILTFAPGITRRRIAITVKGDDIDEYDETVVLRLSNPTNATLPDNVAALESTGTIIDNNEPPTVSLLDSEPVEEGEVAVFPVRLSGESGKPITVNWKTSSGTALEDVDYHGGSEQITIHAGTVEKTVEITTIDDREIEDWTENFSVALSDPVNVTPESIKATGIIKDDDRPAAIERLERVNKTILPYVGSAIMRSRIDHVTGCIKHAASGVAYGDLSSFEGQLRNNADILEQHQMERISFLDVFNDARFASGFKAYEEKHNPGDVTFCAGSDWNELSGGDDDPVTWDGSLAGTHLGGNVRISEWILTGLDLFLYTGSFDWKDEGGEEEFRGIEGEWNLNIRGVNPYVALLSEDGETQFWTMAGYGFGRVDIEEEILDQSADITMKSVALGGAVPLRRGSGNVSLSLRGDVWLGEFEIAENGDLIKGVSVQTRGARALLESTWNRGSITPSLLVGVKHDNSSSDSTGMEIGSGIEWGSSSHGLRVSLKSRALLVRSSVQEWGVSGDVNLSPRDGLGPSLRLTTSRGDAEERASTFLEDDSETLLGESGEGGISFEAEAGWGIGTAGGRGTMTPFAGVSLLERDERVLRLGGRLDMGKTLNLQLEGQREKNEINGSEYGLLLEAKFSF